MRNSKFLKWVGFGLLLSCVFVFQNCAPNFKTQDFTMDELSTNLGSELPENSDKTASVKIAWDQNDENLVSGYKVYYGNASGQYTKSIDVGMRSASNGSIIIDIPGLDIGKTYYFAVVAYDSAKIESALSNEISKLIVP